MHSASAFSAVTRSGNVRRAAMNVQANSLININARYHPYVRVQAAPLPRGPPAEGSRFHPIVVAHANPIVIEPIVVAHANPIVIEILDAVQAAPLPQGPPAEGSRYHAIVIPDEPVVIVIPDEPVVIVIPDEPQPAPAVPWVQAYPLPQGMDMEILAVRNGTGMAVTVRNASRLTVTNTLINVIGNFLGDA